MKLFGSKKATVTAVGAGSILALAPLLVYLIHLALPDVPQEQILEFVTLVLGVIGGLLASYNVAQGYADGNPPGFKELLASISEEPSAKE